MHTPTLNETFLCTLHTGSRCRVSYDTSTGGMDARAALGRESEYVFHSKEKKELSRALDLPGFHCRMVLTFSQKSILISSFPIEENESSGRITTTCTNGMNIPFNPVTYWKILYTVNFLKKEG